mmetsp:Transcript_39473/g.85166  ORF Transcript_39473/g.85166 Transcript_39473/m.85166 type:complete len:108 (+) Transcript_39473:321-644(+)
MQHFHSRHSRLAWPALSPYLALSSLDLAGIHPAWKQQTSVVRSWELLQAYLSLEWQFWERCPSSRNLSSVGQFPAARRLEEAYFERLGAALGSYSRSLAALLAWTAW